MKMKLKLPEIRKKKKKKGYDYSKDINRDGCTHIRRKIFEVTPKWQEGTASFIIECEDCTKLGVVDGVIDYYKEEVQWQDE